MTNGGARHQMSTPPLLDRLQLLRSLEGPADTAQLFWDINTGVRLVRCQECFDLGRAEFDLL